MKKTFIGVTGLLIILLGFILLISIQSPGPSGSPHSDTIQKESIAKKQSQLAANQPAIQKSDTLPEAAAENKAATTEAQEAVAQVIESAQGLFLKRDINIVAIGDSLTEGVGDHAERGGYVSIIANTLKNNKSHTEINVENFGKRGDRTEQLVDRLKQKNISSSIEEADIILITIGANDVMKIVRANFSHLTYEDFVKEQQQYKKRLQTILDEMTARNPDANIYLLGIYNPFGEYFSDIKEMDQIIADWDKIGSNVVSQYDNGSFIPIKDLFQNPKENLFYEDNFHPNDKGYKRMAARVLHHIKPEIEN